jgi:hypothetical protein
VANVMHQRQQLLGVNDAYVKTTARTNPAGSDAPIPVSSTANPVQDAEQQAGDRMAVVSYLPELLPVAPPAPPAPVAVRNGRRESSRYKKRTGDVQPARVQQSASRNYEFTLTPVQRFKRVGPIQASLRRIDWKRSQFDVSLLVGNLRIEKKHIKLHEPISFRLGAKPVQLLTDRIGRNYIHGYLCESGCRKQESAGPSQRKPNVGSSKRESAVADSRLRRKTNGA